MADPVNYVATIADLKATDTSGFPNNQTIKVLGYFQEDDGGGGAFYWDNNSSETDDDGTIIEPTFSGFGGTGRWKRVIDQDSVYVEWFGIDGSNDHLTIQKAIDYAKDKSIKGSKTEITLETNKIYVCNGTIDLDNVKTSLNGNGGVLDYSNASNGITSIIITQDSNTYRLSSYKLDSIKNLSLIGKGKNNGQVAVRVNLSGTGNLNPSFANVTVSKFGTAFDLRNNVWGEVFHTCQMTECNIIINEPSGLSNSAERLSFIDCLLAESNTVFKLGSNDYIHLTNCSIDYNNLIYEDENTSLKVNFWFDHCNIESAAMPFFDLINSSVIIKDSNFWNAGRSTKYKLTLNNVPSNFDVGDLIAGETTSAVARISQIGSNFVIGHHQVNEFYSEGEKVYVAEDPSTTAILEKIEPFAGIIKRNPTEFGSRVSIQSSLVVSASDQVVYAITGTGRNEISNIITHVGDAISPFAILDESNNRIFNGSFEEGSDGWSLAGNATITSNESYRGSNSLSIETGDVNNNAFTFVPYNGEKNLYGRLFVKPNSPETGGMISIRFYFDKNTPISQATTDYLFNSMQTGIWNRVSFNIREQIPAEANYLQIFITNQFGSGGQPSYFDHFLLNLY